MAVNMTLAGDSEFKNWVSQLKKDIRSTQIKAAIKVNTELLRLYWRMGADICEKQKSASWGDGWLKELSRELMAEFPDMKGLSHRNLQYIRQWYLFYNQRNTIVQQVVAQIPWGLNIVILDKITDKSIRRWYIEKTNKNGWSKMFLRIREYSLKDMSNPMGVSEYKVGNVLPKDLSEQLPSIEDIQKRIK